MAEASTAAPRTIRPARPPVPPLRAAARDPTRGEAPRGQRVVMVRGPRTVVGLVVFGETAFTQSPLSSDGRLLEAALGRTRPGMAGGATALGDALALAVKRVTALEPTSGADGPGTGRLVVLLTDGRHNAGAIPPDVAAGLAAQRGVRVHTVGIGGEGEVAMARPGAEGRRGLRLEFHDLDAGTLEAIAVATGGRYFEARRSSDLEAVYASIDALERVPRPAPPRRRQAPHPEPFLAGAAVAVALELLCVRGLSIYGKLSVHRRREAVARARVLHLIDPDGVDQSNNVLLLPLEYPSAMGISCR